MMEDCLVVFFDLLGFSSIIQTADKVRQEKLLELLTQLAEEVGDFEYKIFQVDNSTTKHEARPAISSFSDHIVYSFPIDKLKPFGSGPVFFYIVEQTVQIFQKAMQVGCLIRGGIAIGQLYHKANVIFGPAMIEAYKLESKFAKTPRILLSEPAFEFVNRHPFVRRDEDGFAILDYINAAYQTARSGETLPLTEDSSGRTWQNQIKNLCKVEIEKLESAKNLAGLQYWRWFLTQFNRL